MSKPCYHEANLTGEMGINRICTDCKQPELAGYKGSISHKPKGHKENKNCNWCKAEITLKGRMKHFTKAVANLK